MKKAEIIKNGNVNLNTLGMKKGAIYMAYIEWAAKYGEENKKYPSPTECFNWLWEKLS